MGRMEHYLLRVAEAPFLFHAAFRLYRNGNREAALHRILCLCHGFGRSGLMRRIMRWDAQHLPLTAAAHRGNIPEAAGS
jgi:hypothetical protein